MRFNILEQMYNAEPIVFNDSRAKDMSAWVMPDWLPPEFIDLPESWYIEHLDEFGNN